MANLKEQKGTMEDALNQKEAVFLKHKKTISIAIIVVIIIVAGNVRTGTELEQKGIGVAVLCVLRQAEGGVLIAILQIYVTFKLLKARGVTGARPVIQVCGGQTCCRRGG